MLQSLILCEYLSHQYSMCRADLLVFETCGRHHLPRSTSGDSKKREMGDAPRHHLPRSTSGDSKKQEMRDASVIPQCAFDTCTHHGEGETKKIMCSKASPDDRCTGGIIYRHAHPALAK